MCAAAVYMRIGIPNRCNSKNNVMRDVRVAVCWFHISNQKSIFPQHKKKAHKIPHGKIVASTTVRMRREETLKMRQLLYLEKKNLDSIIKRQRVDHHNTHTCAMYILIFKSEC